MIILVIEMENKGKLIIVEGACDGIGKSTQYEKLYQRLVNDGYEVLKHHFPSYGTFHGLAVEKYLAGEFGKIKELSPYFINSLYANDRAIAWYLELKKAYDSGMVVLLDRYTTSSIIYQASVIEDIEERKKFIDYVNDYEYSKLGIGEPDMVIFLEAPFDMVTKMRNSRSNYEGNSQDIHETNLEFMKKVYDNAIFVANYLNWERIVCNNGDRMLDIDTIHENICKRVLKK